MFAEHWGPGVYELLAMGIGWLVIIAAGSALLVVGIGGIVITVEKIFDTGAAVERIESKLGELAQSLEQEDEDENENETQEQPK